MQTVKLFSGVLYSADTSSYVCVSNEMGLTTVCVCSFACVCVCVVCVYVCVRACAIFV